VEWTQIIKKEGGGEMTILLAVGRERGEGGGRGGGRVEVAEGGGGGMGPR